MKVVSGWIGIANRLDILSQQVTAAWRLHRWQDRSGELAVNGGAADRAPVSDLVLASDARTRLAESRTEDGHLVIGEIDLDGFVLSRVGPLKDVPIVSDQAFLRRKRHQIKLIDRKGSLAVVKSFGSNKRQFLNELHALHTFNLAGCNVPALLDVDFNRLDLTMSYIAGPVLREALANKGALIRDRDVREDPKLKRLSEPELKDFRINEGRRVLPQVIDDAFIKKLYAQIRKIHALGIGLGDLKYGNIIVEKQSGDPYLIDFEKIARRTFLGNRYVLMVQKRNFDKLEKLFGPGNLPPD